MGNSIKIDMDIIDEMSEKDKKEFIWHQYHRCDIFIYRGQTCFSSRFIEYILENLQNKTDNKKLIENLEEAVQYGSGGIGYQHLRLNPDAITNKHSQEIDNGDEEDIERRECKEHEEEMFKGLQQMIQHIDKEENAK